MSKYVNLCKPGIGLIVLVIISVFLCLGNRVSGQSTAEIQNIQFTTHNDTMTVTYDIVQEERKELFDISLVITTESGKLIRPRAVSGDVGCPETRHSMPDVGCWIVKKP